MANKRSKGPTVQQEYDVAASSTIADADFVMGVGATGHKKLAVAEAGNEGVVGLSDELVDNSSGAGAAKQVRVLEGVFLVTGVGLVAADEGHVMYLSSAAANTIDRTRDGATSPVVGILKRFVSATSGWCQMSAQIARSLLIDLS